MATKLITVTPRMDIREAMEILVKRKISGAPVLDENQKLVGMLSEVDCLKILVNGPYYEGPNQVGLVEDFMSTKVTTIEADRTILDAAYLFVNSGLKRLPVCEAGHLVGQISRVDVLRAISKMRPFIKHVPDSWRGREPVVPESKRTQYDQNA